MLARRRPLFGDYVQDVWWPTWKAQHPDSAYQTGKRIEKRILPFFGDLRFAGLDADRVGAWKAHLADSELKPSSVNSYLSLLGTILNAAVDSDYLPYSPLMRRSRAGRVAAAKNLPVDRREVWVTRAQLDLLAHKVPPRYLALVVTAALTGLRWGELAALRWDEVDLDRPLDDGAIAGPGRLRVVRAVSVPSRCGRERRTGDHHQRSGGGLTVGVRLPAATALAISGRSAVGTWCPDRARTQTCRARWRRGTDHAAARTVSFPSRTSVSTNSGSRVLGSPYPPAPGSRRMIGSPLVSGIEALGGNRVRSSPAGVQQPASAK